MMRCNLEGVPEVVQKVTFDSSMFMFHFRLFDGLEYFMDADMVQGMSLTTIRVWDEQFEQAEQVLLRRFYT